MSVSLPGTINRENTDLKGRLWQARQRGSYYLAGCGGGRLCGRNDVMCIFSVSKKWLSPSSLVPVGWVVGGGRGMGKKGRGCILEKWMGKLSWVPVLQVIKHVLFHLEGVQQERQGTHWNDSTFHSIHCSWIFLLGEAIARGTHVRMASVCPVRKAPGILPYLLNCLLSWFILLHRQPIWSGGFLIHLLEFVWLSFLICIMERINDLFGNQMQVWQFQL